MRKPTETGLRKILGIAGSVAGSLFVANQMAKAAEVKPKAEVPIWVADGTTQNTLNVFLDNNGLNDEPTDGFDCKILNNGPHLNWFVNGSESVPTVNDFYQGIPTNDTISPPLGLTGRFTIGIGAGPINHTGNIVEYGFIVPQGTLSGTYSFEMDPNDTFLYDPNANEQPRTLVPGSVRIVQDHNEGLTSCMNGPGTAYPVGMGCEIYDFNFDNDVDIADWAALQTSAPSLPPPSRSSSPVQRPHKRFIYVEDIQSHNPNERGYSNSINDKR